MSSTHWNDEQERPLQHLRVIDMTVMLPGPLLTRTLAQYGADVVKVENLPAGDPIRQLTHTGLNDWVNQGKKSVAIKLKSDEGVDLVRQLAGEADVFVENFREGVLDGLGLGYADMSEANPDLLYVSLRGFAGKNAGLAGHDLNFIAASGVGEWFLEQGGNYAALWGDWIGGYLSSTVKILAHLSNPERRGMQLTSFMDEGFRALFMPRAYDAIRAESLPLGERAAYGLHRSFDGSLPHSRYYRCKDGQWIALNAVQPKHWHRFCEIVGQPGWAERAADRALTSEIDQLFVQQPASHWEALLTAKDACAFRVLPWTEHLAFTDAKAQIQKDIFAWAGFAPNPQLLAAPELGRDTFAVLNELGIGNKEVSDYLNEKIIYAQTPVVP